jgi:hypothetical protein
VNTNVGFDLQMLGSGNTAACSVVYLQMLGPEVIAVCYSVGLLVRPGRQRGVLCLRPVELHSVELHSVELHDFGFGARTIHAIDRRQTNQYVGLKNVPKKYLVVLAF